MFGAMFFIQAVLLGLALAMDSFTVSITCGLQKSLTKSRTLFMALCFGFFQGFMPLLGAVLGTFILGFVESIAYWIAFILLFIIGLKMIMEGRNFSLKSKVFDVTSTKVIILLGIATSIDALAVGLSFYGMNWVVGEQLLAVFIIFLVTFIMSLIGEKMGEKIYFIKPRVALTFGGFVLIFIGVKTVVEHYWDQIINLFKI